VTRYIAVIPAVTPEEEEEEEEEENVGLNRSFLLSETETLLC
jgi:hypothetical protein